MPIKNIMSSLLGTRDFPLSILLSAKKDKNMKIVLISL